MEQGIHRLLEGSILRVIFYEGMNATNAERLRKTRPLPTYYAVLATTENMQPVFKEVQRSCVFFPYFRHLIFPFWQLEKNEMLSLEDRWNLVFLDFKTTHFEHHAKYPKISALIPNPEMCCKFSANCDCSTEVDVSMRNDAHTLQNQNCNLISEFLYADFSDRFKGISKHPS